MEEETTVTEEVQGDVGSSERESGADGSNNSLMPTKKARGRPKGSKKLQVWVTHVNLTEVGSDLVQKASSEDGSGADNDSPKKRGRPKGSPNKRTLNKHVASQNIENGGPSVPKKGRGRPKGFTPMKRKAESAPSGEEDDDISSPPKKRGRPKGSVNKKPRLVDSREVSSEEESGANISNGNPNPPKKGRGRPKKHRAVGEESSGPKPLKRGRGRPRKDNSALPVEQERSASDGSQPSKRGRGRPKGLLAKKPPSYKAHSKVGRPRKEVVAPATTGKKRGRPRKEPLKRGRPRKYPLPPPEELKRSKVWKPLGRPRKYPHVDPPEGSAPTPRRGRPRKAESKKKGAHLRKSLSSTTPSSCSTNDGSPRKRGRPPRTVTAGGGSPKKRGRPKGSVKKDMVVNETQLNSALPAKRPHLSRGKKDSTDETVSKERSGRRKTARVSYAEQDEFQEEEEVEEEVEQEVDEDTEETIIDQDGGFPPLDENETCTEAAMD